MKFQMAVHGFLSRLNRGECRLALSIVFIFSLHVYYWFPGLWGYDTTVQFRNASEHFYGDWHPPIMSYLWHWLLYLGSESAPIFIFYMSVFWVAVSFISFAMLRVYGFWIALLPVALAAMPFISLVIIWIYKDSVMTSVYLLTFSIIFLYRIYGKNIGYGMLIALGALDFFAALMRINSLPIAVVLAIYAVRPKVMERPVKMMVCVTVFTVFFIPHISTVNRLLTDEKQHIERSLFVFDLMGISHLSGDAKVFGFPDVTQEMIDACYTPTRWDLFRTISGYDCLDIHTHMHDMRASHWIEGIFKYPAMYVSHRLVHFNQTLLGFVPRHSYSWHVTNHDFTGYVTYLNGNRWSLDHALEASNWIPFFRPFFHLLLAVVLIFVHRESISLPRHGPLNHAILALSWSGLLYLLTYAVVGVATESRYTLWSSIAVMLAFIMALAQGSYKPRDKEHLPYTAALTALFVSMIVCQLWMRDPLIEPIREMIAQEKAAARSAAGETE